VKETSATADLLTLIGHAIEQLQRSVTLFEASEPDGGVERLSGVVEEIDAYMRNAEEDPLLRLASLPPSDVRERLLAVRGDLTAVIDSLRPTRG
jgi:hypothetical protein